MSYIKEEAASTHRDIVSLLGDLIRQAATNDLSNTSVTVSQLCLNANWRQ